MKFGLKKEKEKLKKMMKNVLSGLKGKRCFVLIEEIVIYEKYMVDNERKLREVFRRLRK